MKRILATVVVAATAFTLTAAPASAQSREHQQMAAELRIMHEQLQELILANEKAMAQLAESVKAMNAALNARMDKSEDATRKSLADQKVIIDNVGSELRVIRERTQDTNTRIGTLREEVGALNTAISLINSQPAAHGPDSTTSSADPSAGGAPAPAPAATATLPRSGLTPTRLYDTAWADYTSGSWKLAVQGFQQFLSEYPKSDRADDAQFYIAESYVKLKQLPEAITAYTTVVQAYPTSDQAPEAYYRLGEVQRSLGRIEEARAAWETAVKKFPESNGGIIAKQRLDGLPPPAVAPRQP